MQMISVCAVVRMSRAVLQALQPFMTEVRDDLTSLKECLTSLSETVTQLSGGLDEHKNWTRYELADLDSSIDNLSDAVLQTLLSKESSATDLRSGVNDRNDESRSSKTKKRTRA